MRRVNRLIRIFHQSWTEKLQANLQLSTKDGEISIKLDLQLGRPEDIMPGPVAAGHPAGAPQRRRPRRHRGPAAKERSRQRAAAYHASRASSGAQTGAQAPFPPPPPPAPQVSSTRLIKVVKKSVGSQHSFFNLDGARASIDSADRLSISSERPEEEEADEADEEEGSVPSPAASPEPHLPDDVLIWVEGRPMLVPGTCDIATKYPDASLEGPWEYWEQEERRKKEEEKEEKEEESDTTDPTDPLPTLGSSRNSADPEVTTEPTYEDRCLRPLQRARDRRAARLQQESDARAVTNFDPHDSSSGRSSASCNLEQDRPQLQCCGCNKILSESDLSSVEDLNLTLKRAGPSGLALLAETEDVPVCAACRNHWSL